MMNQRLVSESITLSSGAPSHMISCIIVQFIKANAPSKLIRRLILDYDLKQVKYVLLSPSVKYKLLRIFDTLR